MWLRLLDVYLGFVLLSEAHSRYRISLARAPSNSESESECKDYFLSRRERWSGWQDLNLHEHAPQGMWGGQIPLQSASEKETLLRLVRLILSSI